ncbi:MAG: hypothetical protein HFG80_02175 [Eubacterium sp.]|nr:hypothetical protein [Eubacterium sp.]
MNAQNVSDTFLQYVGNEYIWILVILATGFLAAKAPKHIRKKLLVVLIAAVIIPFNDFARKVIGQVAEFTTYYRFLWMIPVVFLLSAALAEATTKVKKMWGRVICVLLALCCAVYIVPSFYARSNVVLPANAYGISEDVIEVSDIISADKSEENPSVGAAYGLLFTLHVYDPSLLWGISRNAFQYFDRQPVGSEPEKYVDQYEVILAVSYGVTTDPTKLQEAVRGLELDYLVVKNDLQAGGLFEAIGCQNVGVGANYTVYRLV